VREFEGGGPFLFPGVAHEFVDVVQLVRQGHGGVGEDAFAGGDQAGVQCSHAIIREGSKVHVGDPAEVGAHAVRMKEAKCFAFVDGHDQAVEDNIVHEIGHGLLDDRPFAKVVRTIGQGVVDHIFLDGQPRIDECEEGSTFPGDEIVEPIDAFPGLFAGRVLFRVILQRHTLLGDARTT